MSRVWLGLSSRLFSSKCSTKWVRKKTGKEEKYFDHSAWNASIALHAKTGHLEKAVCLFNSMATRDAVSWNSIIAAYAQYGYPRKALSFALRMESEENIKPTKVTLICILNACSCLRDFGESVIAHSKIVRFGFDSDVIIFNSLINTYGKCGKIEHAFRVFKTVATLFRDVVSWNAMIGAYAHNGHPLEGIQLARQMILKEGIKPSKITLIIALDTCATLVDIINGRITHARVAQSGFEGELALDNALINMYGNCGNLIEAKNVFVRISWHRDLISWNAMIAAFSKNGQVEESLELYHRMHMEGLKPDKITFVSTLDACTLDIGQGKIIHACVACSKLNSEVIVGNALLKMYSGYGCLEDAKKVFDNMPRHDVISWTSMCTALAQNRRLEDARKLFEGMPQRDVISWAAMISAFAHGGQSEHGIAMFQRMVEGGVKPNKVTFLCILDVCTSLDQCKKIHACTIASEYESDAVIANALVKMYGKCGSIEDAWNAFEGITLHRRDVVAWTTMIALYAHDGQCDRARRLFEQMVLEGVKPNEITFLSILDACITLEDLRQGKAIHANSACFDFISNIVVANALISMYSNCGILNDAKAMFERMLQRNVASWNAMISAFVKNGDLEDARSIFDAMHERDVVSWNSMISAYAKNGHLDHARNLFNEMAEPDMISWNSMIVAYAQDRQDINALELFEKMILQGVKPDQTTYIGVLDSCASLVSLKMGKIIHAKAAYCGYDLDVTMATALIDMYGKCGVLEDARRIFDRVSMQDAVSWNAMIAAYAHNGHSDGVLKLFGGPMDTEGVNADEGSFKCVLSACSHAGLLNDGCHFFLSMRIDHDIIPTVEHFMCMIDLFGRAGRLDEAVDFINASPVQLQIVSWMSLLGALNRNRQSKIGEAQTTS